MRILIPFVGDEQDNRAAGHIQRAVKYALLPIAGDRHTGLLSDATITTIEWRRFRDDRFIKHKHDGALCAPQPTF